MSRNGGEEGAAGGENVPRISSTSRIRARTGPDPFLVICRCFSFLTALTAILCVAVNVLSAVRSFKNGSDVFNGIFRCYAVVISLIVVVAETEWSFATKFWKVLEYWAGRGMLQILYVLFFRSSMHRISQTFSPTERSYKGPGNQGSRAIGTAEGGT